MYTALALANLFGHLLGAKGKIFIFEMDEMLCIAIGTQTGRAKPWT